MDIIQIVAIGIIAAIIAILLKAQAKEFSFAISLMTCILILVLVFPKLKEIMDVLIDLANKVNVDMKYLVIILKIIGVAYIAEFGAELLKDAGESAIASKIELGGKVIVMSLSIPILQSLIEVILTMLPS